MEVYFMLPVRLHGMVLRHRDNFTFYFMKASTAALKFAVLCILSLTCIVTVAG
jgi:hypothetical protein